MLLFLSRDLYIYFEKHDILIGIGEELENVYIFKNGYSSDSEPIIITLELNRQDTEENKDNNLP